jgi:hypothetical protein
VPSLLACFFFRFLSLSNDWALNSLCIKPFLFLGTTESTTHDNLNEKKDELKETAKGQHLQFSTNFLLISNDLNSPFCERIQICKHIFHEARKTTCSLGEQCEQDKY